MLNTVGVCEARSTNIIYPPSVIFVVEARHVARTMSQRNCTTNKQYCHLVSCMRFFFILHSVHYSIWLLVPNWTLEVVNRQLHTTWQRQRERELLPHQKRMTFFIYDFQFKSKHIYSFTCSTQINYSVLKVPDCMQPHDYQFFFVPHSIPSNFRRCIYGHSLFPFNCMY